MKRIIAIFIAMAMLIVSAQAVAAAGIFDDVADGAWYADAVGYVSENSLMNGTSETTFEPDGQMTRAMLVTVLWRAAGKPAANVDSMFGDVAADTYYADAVAWASGNNIVNGYSDEIFAPDDPVSRAQIVTILWRYAGSPTAEADDFADENEIPDYASEGVDWARANRIVNGRDGDRFDPNGNATRAEVATILRNYLTLEENAPDTPDEPEAPTDGKKTLVVYFSASGSTRRVAEAIAEATNADIFELVPTDPYTSADLNWTTAGSRVNREHDDESLRDIELESTTVDNWDDYDTVFIGYPIWWGIAAWSVDGFVKANDFTGKTVIPFCTSASSGIGQSGKLLAEMAGTGDWQEGRRFSSGASESSVKEWVGELGL